MGVRPFTRGAFVGDFMSIVNDTPLSTSLLCVGDGVVYYVKKADLLRFFKENPGFQLMFLKARFVE
jgi:hypothetical protein